MRLPELNQNDGVMTRGFLSRPENGFCIAGVNEDAKLGVDAEKVEAAAIRNAFVKGVARLPDPDYWLRALGACGAGERKNKTQGARRVAIIARAKFVNGAAREGDRSAGPVNSRFSISAMRRLSRASPVRRAMASIPQFPFSAVGRD